jgi:hypothetical protein
VDGAELQAFQPQYSQGLPVSGTFYEYAELAIQFGYVTLFAPAFPLAPIFAICRCMLASARARPLRCARAEFTNSPVVPRCVAGAATSWSTKQTGQRSFWPCKSPITRAHSVRTRSGQRWYQDAQPARTDIGTWGAVFRLMSYMAVVTNCLIVAFTSRQLEKLMNTADVVRDHTRCCWHDHPLTRPPSRAGRKADLCGRGGAPYLHGSGRHPEAGARQALRVRYAVRAGPCSRTLSAVSWLCSVRVESARDNETRRAEQSYRNWVDWVHRKVRACQRLCPHGPLRSSLRRSASRTPRAASPTTPTTSWCGVGLPWVRGCVRVMPSGGPAQILQHVLVEGIAPEVEVIPAPCVEHVAPLLTRQRGADGTGARRRRYAHAARA